MNVSFPKLGWEFEIDNVAFDFPILGHPIYWYGVLIAVGFVLAFTYAVCNAKRFKIEVDPLIDVVIVCLVCAILGARAYYVIFNFDGIYVPGEKYTFWSAILRFFEIWNGGMAIYGGVIAAFVSGWFMCKFRKLNPWAVFDIASIGFLIGQCIGRWGNFMNQEAFGSQTDSLFGMVSENTGGVPVHPCFFYESLWCLAGFFILHFVGKHYKKFDGQLFFMYLLWYGLGRFWIESLRTDSLWLVPDVIKVSQLVAAVCVLASAIILVIKFRAVMKKEQAVKDLAYESVYCELSDDSEDEE